MYRIEELFERLRSALSKIGCEKYVDVESAHISGISYINIGEPGLEFLRELHNSRLKVKIFTTCNPMCMCVEDLEKYDTDVSHRQKEIMKILKDMNVSTWFTCVPYEFQRIRSKRFYAWSESSAVAFINSIYDAYSEKFPGPLSLLSALTGKTPLLGLAIPENRRPRILVRIDNERPLNIVEAGVLGKFLGEMYSENLDVIYLEYNKNLFRNIECIKSLLAAYATFSNSTLIIFDKLSVNYKSYRKLIDIEDKLTINLQDIKREIDKLSIEYKSLDDFKKSEILIIGCPHLSRNFLNEILRNYCRNIETNLWIFASRFNRSECSRCRGIRVIYDTCLFVSSYLDEIVSKYDVVYTNSVKQHHYLSRRVRNIEVRLSIVREIEKIINTDAGKIPTYVE